MEPSAVHGEKTNEKNPGIIFHYYFINYFNQCVNLVMNFI